MDDSSRWWSHPPLNPLCFLTCLTYCWNISSHKAGAILEVSINPKIAVRSCLSTWETVLCLRAPLIIEHVLLSMHFEASKTLNLKKKQQLSNYFCLACKNTTNSLPLCARLVIDSPAFGADKVKIANYRVAPPLLCSPVCSGDRQPAEWTSVFAPSVPSRLFRPSLVLCLCLSPRPRSPYTPPPPVCLCWRSWTAAATSWRRCRPPSATCTAWGPSPPMRTSSRSCPGRWGPERRAHQQLTSIENRKWLKKKNQMDCFYSDSTDRKLQPN